MQPLILTLRALVERGVALSRDALQLQATPSLHETLQALRSQVASAVARLLSALRFSSPSNVFAAAARVFIKLARLCLEALDWLLLPRLAWKITVRHCVALLVLYAVKVFWNSALVPVARILYNAARPLFVNAEYLQQEKLLKGRIANARDYSSWKKAASELDRLQGRYHWKESAQSLHYDWRRIRDDLQHFRELVDNQDVRGIMAFSRSRLLRNLVGINDRRLYTHLRAGTKRLIEEYISEVVRALQLVCVADGSPAVGSADGTGAARTLAAVQQGAEEDGDADGMLANAAKQPLPTTAEKLSFFNETRHAFGRSALLLSGGATLGLYHIGVMKALHDNNLLPRVLSGSSVGSIICAMVGTRTDEELNDLFSPEGNSIKLNFFPPNGGSVRRKITRLFTQGVLMDIKILKRCVKANVAPLTFQEAYELSGRIINIVVSPASGSGNKDSLRLLNYLTAPNVLVWSAALASCAIPGVYSPVELMKKDETTGKLVPYLEGGAPVKWEDGSVQADLPMQRLSELFNVNHFIVSQVNPHICWAVSSASSTHTAQSSFLTAPVPKLLDYLSSQLKSTVLNFLHLNILPIHPSVKYVLDQKYLGDITLVPRVKPFDYTQLLVNPTRDRLRDCILQSEFNTWQLIPTIRGACEIEFTLDECVRRMRGTLILEELSDARRLSKHMSRVRSWSSDLLAVGQRPCAHNQCDGTPGVPLPLQGRLGGRTHSEFTMDGVQRAAFTGQAPDSHTRDPGRWTRKQGQQSSVKRSHTVLTLANSGSPRHGRFRGAHVQHQSADKRLLEHEAEDDDVVSEEEDEEAERRAQQLRWEQGLQSDPDADLADATDEEHRGEEGQCVFDDEGIQRQCVPLPTPPIVTPSPVTLGVSTPNEAVTVAPPPLPTAAAASTSSPGKSALKAARRLNVSNVPKHVNIFSPAETPRGAAHPVPEWRTVAPAEEQLAKPPAEAPTLQLPDPALFSPPSDHGAVPSILPLDAEANVMARLQPPQPPQPQQPLPIAQPRRRWEGERAVSAHAIPSSFGSSSRPPVVPQSRSRPRTPDPIPRQPLRTSNSGGAADWNQERASPVLSQLLKTSQAKVHGGLSRRNVRPTGRPQHASSTPVQPTLHIPSLVSFRHTPPRRMSTMDLARLDDDNGEGSSAASSTHGGSHHSLVHHAAGLHRGSDAMGGESSDDQHTDGEDASSRASAPPASDEISLTGWLHRASSFLTGEEDHEQALRARESRLRSLSDSAQPSQPQSPVTESEPASPASPRAAEEGAVHRAAAQQPLVPSVAADVVQPTPHPPTPAQLAADRERLRSTARFAAAVSVANPNPILRAATNGLPRTLSQIELVSDVATMP